MSNSNVKRRLTREELMQLENYDPEYKANSQLAPCKDCPNRCLGCHSKCYKYQVFRQERNKYAEAARRAREEYSNDHLCDLSKAYHRDYICKRKRRK